MNAIDTLNEVLATLKDNGLKDDLEDIGSETFQDAHCRGMWFAASVIKQKIAELYGPAQSVA